MPPSAAPLTFSTLQRRLLLHLRGLLANGEITERGLARMAGVSQPHIHNVVKGVRVLTSDVGDLLCGTLGLSVLELAESDELGAALEERRRIASANRFVRMAAGRISPFERFPELASAADWVAMPSGPISRLARPELTGFEADPEIAPLFGHATHALLDLDERVRLPVRDARWYALRWGGAGYVRQLRRENGTLVVLGQKTWRDSPLPDRIPLGDLPALSIIRGSVEWLGPDPRRAAPILQEGEFLSAATVS
jgi:hypothetical protein